MWAEQTAVSKLSCPAMEQFKHPQRKRTRGAEILAARHSHLSAPSPVARAAPGSKHPVQAGGWSLFRGRIRYPVNLEGAARGVRVPAQVVLKLKETQTDKRTPNETKTAVSGFA